MRITVLLLGCCLCLFIGNSTTAKSGQHSHHHHSQLDVSNLVNKPKVELKVIKDSVSGWNVYAKTTNFRFAPENVNSKQVIGEGHAHLYVDGKKITRLYSQWYHLNSLSKGAHIVKVSLNANDHAELVLGKETVSASVTIIQK